MHTHPLLGPALPSPPRKGEGDSIRMMSGLRQTRLTPDPLACVASHPLDPTHFASLAQSLPNHIRQTASPRSWYLCGPVQLQSWTDLKGAGEKPDLDEREAFGWEHPMNGIWPSCALAETMVAVPR